MLTPAFDGYFADPFVLRLSDGSYLAYGGSGAGATGDRVFETLVSADLRTWQPAGTALRRLPERLGDQYWAPEVAYADGAYWMYFSVGHGIAGHHLRVARSRSPHGPFEDTGVNLTPDETFAIDPHPFLDFDGRHYLFFARDVPGAARAGTHLAVAELSTSTLLAGPATTVLEPNADWQIYERGRSMYGQTLDWHTLEGPSVVRRHGRYWLTYSGGAWTGPGYAVSWGVADHPRGPWQHAPEGAPPLLVTSDELIGPGHNSLTTTASGQDVIAFHAWNTARTARQLHLHHIDFGPTGPEVGGPIGAT